MKRVIVRYKVGGDPREGASDLVLLFRPVKTFRLKQFRVRTGTTRSTYLYLLGYEFLSRFMVTNPRNKRTDIVGCD